jgi:hypothetical protein
MASKYVVGIDLGTTNCVLGYALLAPEHPDVRLLRIPQLTSAHAVEQRESLPSFVYLGSEQEARDRCFDLPWAAQRDFAVGEHARRQAAEMPQRTVAAAKSWLCHSRVDRRAKILPWNAPAEVAKISPVTASQDYLEHLVAAWNAAFPEAPFVEQTVVLTVPASFDAAARELTHEAALRAGLPRELVLLEEPQAAVYNWIVSCGDRWRKNIRAGDKLLVCDVGGGTTDLTLIDVAEEHGELTLQRLAVGNHVLVGGDNMDLALAHYAAELFAQKDVKLDAWQSVSLWHACRTAKETLLAAGGPERHPVSVLGRGSRVIGGTVSVDVERRRVIELLSNGFFPLCGLNDQPQRKRASGFQEIGLPFESDTAITRHLAAFLNAQGQSSGIAVPSHVLFNGGVFKAAPLRQRVLDAFLNWFGETNATGELAGEHDLDFAVAKGAAYYGWAKHHGGVRIRGGVARSYFVGIETAGLAIPGALRPLRALCVVPFGMEEGSEVDVPSAEIGLVLGEPAHFRFFSSAVRKLDRPGDVLDSWDEDELVETDSLETALPTDEETSEPYVPVRFQSRITELGMFELWCVHQESGRRWKLEFSVREPEGDAQ